MVRGPRLVAGLLVVVLLTAGCVDPQDGDDDTDMIPGLQFELDWYERALPNDDDHDHHDRDHHRNLSTPNFRIVSHEPLYTDHHGMNSGGNFCGDLESTDERTLAVTHSFTSDVAFVLFDVTDPEDPFVVGELVMENTHIWDLTLTPDQSHVVLATSQYGQQDEEQPPGPAFPHETPRIIYRDACTGTTKDLAGPEAMLPYHSGIVLVDIADPQDPVVTDYRSLPVLGGHSIVAEEVGGETVVLITVSNIGRADYYVFYGILETPAGAKLEEYSVHQTQPEDEEELIRDLQEPFFMNHDGYLQEHPVTGEAIAYLADGQWGVTILNIDDPRFPEVIARWDEADGIANSDYHFAHSILPIEGTWDDRHYTFFSEECTARQEETPTCLAYVLDTTDPGDPQLAGAWTLPHDVGGWSYPSFSPHYMALVDRTLFIASWHAGLWAIDVSTPETLRTMPSIGVFIPDIEVDHVPEGNYGYQYNQKPVVADVLAHGDHLVAFDGTSGAYILEFDATQPAPAPEPWPLNLPD